MEEKTKKLIEKGKIIAILRKVDKQFIRPVAQALIAGGISLIEVTFDQSCEEGIQNTLASLEILNKDFSNSICVGAGTVMSEKQVKMAVDAGACYMISPNTDKKVIECHQKNQEPVSIPGALTPSEVALAYEYGGDIIKLFPAGELGIPYIKAIRAPLSHIPMMAVGGIDENNLADFMKTGITGVGIGSGITRNDLIREGRFEELTMLAKTYTGQLIK